MFFKPTTYIKNFQTLDIATLKQKGIEVLLIDIDNTLTGSDSNNIEEEAKKFIQTLKVFKIRPIIVSNNVKKRVMGLAQQLDISDICYFALKPLPFSWLYLLNKYQLKKSKVAIMGDQIVTDIMYSKINGIKGILVDPISDKDNIFGKVTRSIESMLCKMSGFNRGEYYDKM